MTKKKWLIILFVIIFVVGCTPSTSAKHSPEWERILNSAKHSTVNLYTWSERSDTLAFLETPFAEKLMADYNLKLVVHKSDYTEILSVLKEDKVNENDVGDIDILWLDESAYKELSSANLLYSGYTFQIEDYSKYLSGEDLDVAYIGATETNRDLMPFWQNQLTFYYNQDLIYDPPEDLSLLEQIVTDNPGKLTYPHPADKVGGTFVRTVILNFVDEARFLEKPLSDEELLGLIKPGLDYLKGLKSNLYQQGTYYPPNAQAMYDLFAKEQIIMTMSFDLKHGDKLSDEDIYPYGTKPFTFTRVGLGDKAYLGIPFNSANKSGAMVVFNELLDESVQVDLMKDDAYYGLPVYTYEMLSEKEVKDIGDTLRSRSIPKVSELIEIRTHDIPEKYHQKIVQYWEQYVK